MLQHALVSIVLYAPLLFFVKLSFLLLYLRVFTTSKRVKWILYATIAFLFGYCLLLVCGTIWQCSPVAKAWDLTIKHGRCINEFTLTLVCAALNIVTDIMILVIPIPLVLALHLPTKQKIGILTMFLTGVL